MDKEIKKAAPGQRKDLGWEEVKTEHLIRDEWIDFRRSSYRMPDGTVFEPYYTFTRRDYVVIVAFDEEGSLLCVQQFRQGIREVTTEFPAGGIENGEDVLSAARRELMEETGCVSDTWTHLLTIPSYATLSDNYAHIYMAENCRKAGTQDLDETEFLNVYTFTPHQIEEMIRAGLFQQAVHVMAWLLAKEQRVLNEEKSES